jgi:hypothetical protein
LTDIAIRLALTVLAGAVVASTAAIAVVTLAVLKWIDIETIRRRRATLLVNGAADGDRGCRETA